MPAFDFSTITEVRLAEGSHSSPQEGMCFMEMTAWFAGEPHSDKPACACPILGSFGIALNDRMQADRRDRLLKPMVPLIAGTRGTWDDERRRAQFLAMWTVNRVMPVWLRAVGAQPLSELADACERASSVTELKDLADLAARAALAARADLADLAALAARADLADLAALAALAARADLADLAALAALAARAARADLAALAARAARAARADLAALADRAARAAEQIETLMIEGLREAILIGPHEGFGGAVDLDERYASLRALVTA